MTDRELLELAAKAAGYEVEEDGMGNYAFEDECPWEPLDDDGDALRLAVKLGMHVECWSGFARVWFEQSTSLDEKSNGDIYAATRSAIVRAAAEIGRQQ